MTAILFGALLIGAVLSGLVWLPSILSILRAWLEEIIDA